MNNFRPFTRHNPEKLDEVLDHTIKDSLRLTKPSEELLVRSFNLYKTHVGMGEIEGLGIEEISKINECDVGWLKQCLRRVESIVERYDNMKSKGVL